MSEVDTKLLDALSREELVARARELLIERPELMTRVELRDEIVRLSEMDEEQRKRARGWLGVARDLVASVVEQRLNLPDAAELIRGTNLRMPKHVPPVATVTLAEIYAAQGHSSRAIKLLDEVLLREPDHTAAAALRRALIEQQAVAQKPEPATRSEIPELSDAAWAAPAEESEPEWERDSVEEGTAPEDSMAAEEDSAAAEEDSISPPDTLAPSSEVRISSVLVDTTGAAVVEQDAPDTDTVDDELFSSEVEADDGFVSALESVSELSPIRAMTESMIPDPEFEADVAQPADASEPLEILLYRRAGSSIACHWSLSDETWEDWAVRNDGQWVIRILEVAVADGPFDCDESDLVLPGSCGAVLCNDVEPTAEVRMALGWKTATHFYPVVIGVEVAGDAPDNVQIAWQPLPGLGDPPPEIWLQCAKDSWNALSMGGP